MPSICTCDHPDTVHELQAGAPGEGIRDPTLPPNMRGPCTICACRSFTPVKR